MNTNAHSDIKSMASAGDIPAIASLGTGSVRWERESLFNIGLESIAHV